MAIALMAGMALAGNASADFAGDMQKAKKWDYTGQRNVAFAFTNGDGAPQNVIEGCAWRVIVVFHRGVDVSNSDIISLDDCMKRGVMQEAVARSKVIAAQLPKRPDRTVARDIADMKVEECGDVCSPKFQQFEATYRKAVSGDVASVRKVSECFVTHDCGAPYNSFQACIWTRDLIRFVGDKDASVRSRRTIACGSERALEFALAQHEQEIKSMRTAR